MEYVEGHTVRDILRDGHAVPIEEAVEISAGVLSALEYSHHAGIVHRDIKPANVMLTPTGAVKVMDFGIARAVADSAATMTQTQAVIGTAQYLSPEQARGETVDARSDLYSAGCLLFELLTGRPPFVGDSPVSVAYQHVREPAPVPSTLASDVPDSLDRITLKALAKERDSRYSTAAEFRSDLEAVLRGGAVAAPAVGTIVPAVAAAEATQVLTPQAPITQALPPTQPPWGTTGLTEVATVPEDEERKRPWLIWLLVAIAVLAVAGIVALLIANANKEKEPETVTIPTLVGKTETEAKNLLQGLDLVYKGVEGTSDSIPEGSVISSDPAEGATATVGDTVTVTISTGTGKVDVPDVTGKSVQEASDILTGLGLTVNPTQKSDDNPKYDEGQVTKTDPAAEESVDSGTAVTLSVSTGLVDVPSFVGKDQKEATDKLNNDLNMRPVVREKESADEKPGTVLSQDRDGLLKQGTQITLEVAIAATTATVPDDLRGMSFDDAVAALKAAGIKGTPTRVDEPSDDTPAGDVLYTNPDSGATVGVNDVIEIHVSSGPATPPEPNPTDTAPPAP
jgi:serine/threonine-protein kinase